VRNLAAHAAWKLAHLLLDLLVCALARSGENKRDRLGREIAATARRAETIRALLAGEAVDGERAAAALGYDLRRIHAAFVLWLDRDDSDALGILEESARGSPALSAARRR
jgi:hypothetical protein